MIAKTMWGYEANIDGVVTFKLLPLTIDSPFVEAGYDPNAKMLVVLSKSKIVRFIDFPRYDQKGKVIGSTKKEVEQLFEHVIGNMEDIRSFIAHNVFNAKHEIFKILDA